MKNTCILSMQRVLNYGSLLQAYSLMRMVEGLGCEVEFIDIEANETENQCRQKTAQFNEGMNLASKNIVYRLLQQDTNPLYILPKIKAKKCMQKKQELFSKNVLHLNEENNNKQYDTCIIGSDEVFNCLNAASWGFTSQLFGNVKQADKVITYAASCGFTRAEDLTAKMNEIIQGAFEHVAAFSVRDQNTERFVREISGREDVSMNLDPVLVGDFTSEMSQCQDVLKKLPKRYCIIYAYSGRIHDEKEIKAILKLCKQQHMTPVSVGGAQKWVHKHLDLSPFEVLVAFKNAQFVVTDTFHGTIFSAKYAPKFSVLVRESNANKLGDLISKLGIEKHRVENISQLPDIYGYAAPREQLDQLIQKERERTIKYLESNV